MRNWFLSDDDTVREGYYSIMDSAEDILAAARPVLEQYVPELLKALESDMIPLTLQMKLILERALADDMDRMKQINDALNQIKREI